MKTIAWIAGGALLLALAFAGVTLLALEGQEVVVLRTFDAQGKPYESRTWIAEEDGSSWIEAANSERAFYRRILLNPNVELVRGDEVHELRAIPVLTEQAHRRIRRLLRQRYGLADAWIGVLADTSASVAIRLESR